MGRLSLALLAAAACLDCMPMLRAQEIKEAPGKEIFMARCVDCHAITDVVSKRKSRDAWDLKVREMIGFGATLSLDDIQVITDYLATNYGL